MYVIELRSAGSQPVTEEMQTKVTLHTDNINNDMGLPQDVIQSQGTLHHFKVAVFCVYN